MTLQALERFLLDGRRYQIVGGIGIGMVNPKRLGLEPTYVSSACWRGYISTYALQGKQLVLEELAVALYELRRDLHEPGRSPYEPRVGPEINGIQPHILEQEVAFFNNVYRELRLPAPFTGNLVIADDSVDAGWQLGRHRPPWAYRKVIDLYFFRGNLFYARFWSLHAVVLRFLTLKWERRK